MANQQNKNQEATNPIYESAKNLLLIEKKSPYTVKNALIHQGIDEESASIIVDNIEIQIIRKKKEQATIDMLYGALWCSGGLVLTIANLGYIFWGAIVFGVLLYIRGMINA